jgi:hypothetical protein
VRRLDSGDLGHRFGEYSDRIDQLRPSGHRSTLLLAHRQRVPHFDLEMLAPHDSKAAVRASAVRPAFVLDTLATRATRQLAPAPAWRRQDHRAGALSLLGRMCLAAAMHRAAQHRSRRTPCARERCGAMAPRTNARDAVRHEAADATTASGAASCVSCCPEAAARSLQVLAVQLVRAGSHSSEA